MARLGHYLILLLLTACCALAGASPAFAAPSPISIQELDSVGFLVSKQQSFIWTFQLTNTNASLATNVAFSLTYSGFRNASLGVVQNNTCNGTINALSDTAQMSLSGGTIPANSFCEIDLNVVATNVAGDYQNTTSPVNSIIGGVVAPSGNGASRLLTVKKNAPSIVTAFNPDTIEYGQPAQLAVTITNNEPNLPLDNVGVTYYSWPQNHYLTLTPSNAPGSNTCSGTISSSNLSGGVIQGGETCQFVLDAFAPVGDWPETTSNVWDPKAETGNTASATLHVAKMSQPPVVSAEFIPPIVTVGSSAKFRVTLQNPNSIGFVNGVSFTNTYPAGSGITNDPNSPFSAITCPQNDSLDAPPGGTYFSTTYAKINVPAGSTCYIEVNVVASTIGNWIDHTGIVTSDTAVDAAEATASISVVAPPQSTKLVFVNQPTNASANSAISPSVTVQVEDENGNVVSADYATVVDLTLDGGAFGASLSGGSAKVVGGVATFSNLKVDKVGNNYQLIASAGSSTGSNSNSFNITGSVGSAAKLVFAQQPSNTAVSVAVAPPVILQVQDANGNVVTTDNSTVNLSLSGGAVGASLTGGSVPAIAGVATFGNLTVDKVGNSYVLMANDGNLVGSQSNAFNVSGVVGSAKKLAFLQQPTAATATSAISPHVSVQIQDANGNVVINDTSVVNLSLSGGAIGASLTGSSAQAIAGVATFDALTVDKVGNNYRLTAIDGNLIGATSNPFNVSGENVGAAAVLVFAQQPTDTAVNAAMAPAVAVQIQDANGNVVTSDTSAITLTLSGGTAGAALVGGSMIAVAGQATFGNLRADKVGTAYHLIASDGSLTRAISKAFDITAGSAAKLVFVQQPTNTAVNTAIVPAVTVQVQDANGNVVTTDSTSTVNLALNGGAAGATLVGGSVKVTAGQATFSNLKVDKVGTYTLTATDGTLLGAQSSAFWIGVTGNLTPIAIGDGMVVHQGVATSVVNGNLTTVLANDFNPNVNAFGSQLVASIVSGPSKGSFTQAFKADGTFTYTNNTGQNDSFQYKACDAIKPALCSTATVKITVIPANQPLPPVELPEAVNDAAVVNASSSTTTLFDGSTSVLANDLNLIVGDTLTASQVGPNPKFGTLQFPPANQPNGSFKYTNTASAQQDGFYYQACDSQYGACSLATVTVNIVQSGKTPPVILLPIAVDDEIQVAPNGTKKVLIGGGSTVLWNDTDPNNANNDNSTLHAWLLGSGPQHGSLQFNVSAWGDGTFKYTNDGTGTTDGFDYQACDGLYGACVAATVTIKIDNSATLNHVPIAVADTITVANGGTASVLSTPANANSVLINDTDQDAGDQANLKAYVLGSGPQHGTLTLNVNGQFSYSNTMGDPATTDSFVYEACDPHGACAAAIVSINIGAGAGPNPTVTCMLPTQVYLAGATSPDGTTDVVNIDLSKLFAPPAGKSLVFSATGLPMPPLAVNGGILSGTLGSANAGSVMATLMASVPNGGSASEAVKFDILSAADHVFRNGFDPSSPKPCQ